MTEVRLNHLLIIHIHNEELYKINIKLIANEFIKVKKSRITTIGLYQFGAIACFSSFVII